MLWVKRDLKNFDRQKAATHSPAEMCGDPAAHTKDPAHTEVGSETAEQCWKPEEKQTKGMKTK